MMITSCGMFQNAAASVMTYRENPRETLTTYVVCQIIELIQTELIQHIQVAIVISVLVYWALTHNSLFALRMMHELICMHGSLSQA